MPALRDRTCVSCMEAQSLNHLTTKEVPRIFFGKKSSGSVTPMPKKEGVENSTLSPDLVKGAPLRPSYLDLFLCFKERQKQFSVWEKQRMSEVGQPLIWWQREVKFSWQWVSWQKVWVSFEPHVDHMWEGAGVRVVLTALR